MILLLALTTPSAMAQDTGFDAHGFHLPAYDGDLRDPLTLPRAGTFERGTFFVGGVFELASAPLVLVTADADGDVLSREPLLDDLVALNLSAGVAVLDRLRLDVAAPVFLYSVGVGGAALPPLLGDVRASATVALLRPDGQAGYGLAVVPWVDLPTGDPDRWLGDRGVGGGGLVAGTYEAGPVTLSADLGVGARSAAQAYNITGGPSLLGGLAVSGLLSEAVSLGGEYHHELSLPRNDVPGSGSGGELLVTARARTTAGAHLLVGAAAGVGQGVSTAAWRVFLGGGFAPSGMTLRRADPDGDGVLGAADACPSEAEVTNGWSDVDGCPDALGTLELQVVEDGQPAIGAELQVREREGRSLDRVSDGSALVVPEVIPGSEWSATATRGGCWKGERRFTASEGRTDVRVELLPAFDSAVQVVVRDETGAVLPGAVVRIEGEEGTCVPAGEVPAGRIAAAAGRHRLVISADGYRSETFPVVLEPGAATLVETTLGRSRVRVSLTRIEIMDKVFFASDSARIEPGSYPVLDEVAVALIARPEIGRVEIGGHTDAEGPEAYNEDLSQRRVESVRAYLVSRGVPAERLVAKGYGESDPIDTNLTERGRSRNRRVEFVILGR